MQSILPFLRQLKQSGLERNIPNIAEETGFFLHFLIQLSGAKNALEIGSANGYSTIFLADALAQNQGKLTAIELSTPSLKEARENLKKAQLQKVVEFIYGDALKILPQLNQKFDFIFLDAQKGHYHLFWEIIKTKIQPRSLVAVDNVLKFQEKTNLFLQKIRQEKKFWHKIFPVSAEDGLMLIYRQSQTLLC